MWSAWIFENLKFYNLKVFIFFSSCELCPRDFVTYLEKKRHLRRHKKYGCSDCKLVFDVWSKYQKHRKMEHDPKGNLKDNEYFLLLCISCNKT